MATTTIAPDKYILNSREAAAFLGVSWRTLQNWRYRGIDPCSVSYVEGKRSGVYYTRQSLIDFIHAHENSHESEGAAK